MEDLISIIIPVYNVEKYIHKCIDSVINQTYKNLEIILVDDGSPDNCGNICDEYAKKDNRIKVIHKENEGVSAARNIGIENATGKWIVFVDSDDWLEKEYCDIMIKTAIKENSDYVICAYNRVYSNKIEKINNLIQKKYYTNEEFLIKVLNVQSSYGFCHTKFIKKEIIINIRFNEELKVGEDAFFNIQIAKNVKKIIHIPNILYNYRFNNESVVRKYDVQYLNKYLTSMKKTKQYIFKEYKNNSTIKQNLYNYIMYHILLICVNYCCNPSNNLSIIQQRKILKEACNIDEFKEAIKKSNYNELSITRKVTLFTLKSKLYIFTIIIGKIRQYQFKEE